MSLSLTRAQARRFLLEKQGLWGERRFIGADGVLAFVRQAGCVQYDPVDSCGRSAELTLLSRVEGYRPALLEELLYGRRALVDYWDKNMAILPMEEWPFLERERAVHRLVGRSRARADEVRPRLLAEIAERGPLCSRDLDYGKDTQWYWSSTTVARAALETLYFRGELCVHHKEGGVKYYDLAERCVPPGLLRAQDGLTEGEYLRRRILRRVGGVGLLWNRASDAFLCIRGLGAPQEDGKSQGEWPFLRGLDAAGRADAFAALLAEGKLVPVTVEGLRDPLYARAEDTPMLEAAAAWDGADIPPRCELLAPLDSVLWDRRLIRALFDFSYTWEIYTVPEKRVYGWYVLPVLLNGALRGRVEPVRDKAAGLLRVRGLWWEPGFRPSRQEQAQLRGALRRLAEMNGLRLEPGLRLGR